MISDSSDEGGKSLAWFIEFINFFMIFINKYRITNKKWTKIMIKF